jgi:hypothetical protein
MNIALSAVIISILLIPPIVLYISFYLGKYPKAIPKFSLFEGILGAAVISLFIHAAAIQFIPYEIRYDIILKLLGGELKDLEKKISTQTFYDTITSFSYYNAWLLLIMVTLGRLARNLLIRTGWHADYPILNLYHKWWYVFNGYYSNIEQYDLVFVDLVVDTNDRTVIYSGYLTNFDFKDGDLDRLYLKDTLKRDFIQTSEHNAAGEGSSVSEPYKIPGDIFSISYKNVLNINIHFILLDNSLEEIQGLHDEDAPE